MLKKLVGFTAAAVAVLAMHGIVSAGEAVSIEIDGHTLAADPPAQITDGRTLVPMRAIFEALDTQIEWDADTKTVHASANGHEISLTVGERELIKDGKSVQLSVPAQIIDGRTFVPARAVSESLDCIVRWDGETKTVYIETDEEKEADYIDGEEPQWISELSNGVIRPEELDIPEKYANDNYMIKEFYVMIFLPKLADIMNESDIVEQTIQNVGIDRFFAENWLSAALTKLGASDFAKLISEGADADSLSEKDKARLAELEELTKDLKLDVAPNFSYNYTLDKDGTFRMVIAKSKTKHTEEGAVFSAIIKDQKGVRYYVMIAAEGGTYQLCSINGANFSLYPLELASDDGDFEDALISPHTFLLMVDTVESNDIKPAETEKIDILANVTANVTDS